VYNGRVARAGEPRDILAAHIRTAAARVVDGELPAEWAGEQLAALVRHWGYAGHDWPMPDAFQEFDLVMMDLECFPDGRMTQAEHIVTAARAVLAEVSPPGTA
jgi:hypothetical protein